MVADEEGTRERESAERLELWQLVSTSEEDHDQAESSYRWILRGTLRPLLRQQQHTLVSSWRTQLQNSGGGGCDDGDAGGQCLMVVGADWLSPRLDDHCCTICCDILR